MNGITQLISMKHWLYVEILQVLIVNGYNELHMKNILNVMNSFFCKEYGKEKTNYSEATEKRDIEAYNLGNRLAERSCKNIGAKLLSEHQNFKYWRRVFRQQY